jgi:hypothetical protein
MLTLTERFDECGTLLDTVKRNLEAIQNDLSKVARYAPDIRSHAQANILTETAELLRRDVAHLSRALGKQHTALHKHGMLDDDPARAGASVADTIRVAPAHPSPITPLPPAARAPSSRRAAPAAGPVLPLDPAGSAAFFTQCKEA